MDIERRLDLITRPPTEEVVTKEGLIELLENQARPKHYIGLETSGLLHLASLVLTGYKINDMIKAGIECTVFLADWHSYINNKFGGQWKKIKLATKYYEEAFKMFCPGIEVKRGSDLYKRNENYWEDYVKFCKRITLARNIRCLTIMGRSEKEKLDFAQYLYPPLQAVDIRALGVDIAHAGMDQRKVHMLAREVFPALEWKPPVAIHHHLLPGLNKPEGLSLDEDKSTDITVSSKMSKSKPWTCIFIHDSDEEIKEKMNRAWCPPRISTGNPILEIIKYVIFHDESHLEIKRPAKFVGIMAFDKYSSLEEAYLQGKIHPADLKLSVAEKLSEIIRPLREYFASKEEILELYGEEMSS